MMNDEEKLMNDKEKAENISEIFELSRIKLFNIHAEIFLEDSL